MALQAGLTDFAEKYGPIPGRNFSGLTPASPAFPQPKTKELRLRSLARDAYQRQTLAGFTARDLVNLDVITSRKLKEANLQNGILPIMARDRWETRPPSPSWKRNYLYPMKDGTGFWTVDNPEVWAVLEPCLKLASRHLMAMNCLPWFDALINGDRRPIPQYRAQLGESVEGLFSYHVPPVNTPEATRVIRDEIFESLRVKWDLRWYFLSPYEMPDGSAQDIRHRAVGVTCTNIEEVVGGYGRSDWVIGIFIEYERLESLMRDDLSSSDRLLVEWELSDTIVHEIMHAIQKSLFTNPFNVREPYFEQNAISEVGFDFQFYVFGGKAMQIFHRMGYVTPGYFYSTSYPTIRGINWCSVGTIPLTNPGPIDREVKFPIPVTFYQDLQQEEFWAVGVRMFGFPLLHYRSVREGSRMNYQYHYNFISKKYEYSIISRDVRISGIQPLHAPSDTFRSKVQVLETMINMTPYQRAARNFGQDIVKSSREEEAFWINHAAQDAAVRRLFTEAARPGSTEEERAELVVNMTRSIQVAAYHHQFMVISTVSTEQGGGALDTERRDRLLAWNKGSRQFIFELISCCDPNADDDNIRKLEDVLVGLELCRMKLYSPLHGPHDSSDYDEFGEIIFAKQTPLLCRPICNKILGDDSSSMFARCCAGIMVCALDANVEEGWQDRRNQLDKYITMLNRFKSPNLQDWIPPLTEWEVYAIEGRNKLNQKYQSAAGQPFPPANAS